MRSDHYCLSQCVKIDDVNKNDIDIIGANGVRIDPTSQQNTMINPLALGRCGYDIKWVILKVTLRVDILSISCEIVLKWMQRDLADDKSTLVQAMAWCHQATSHYLNHCWSNSMTPQVDTKPQWLTHRGMNKMVANLFSWKKKSWKYVPGNLTKDKLVLIEVVPWRRTGDKPMSESVMTETRDALQHHQGPITLQPIRFYFLHSKWKIHASQVGTAAIKRHQSFLSQQITKHFITCSMMKSYKKKSVPLTLRLDSGTDCCQQN